MLALTFEKAGASDMKFTPTWQSGADSYKAENVNLLDETPHARIENSISGYLVIMVIAVLEEQYRRICKTKINISISCITILLSCDKQVRLLTNSEKSSRILS